MRCKDYHILLCFFYVDLRVFLGSSSSLNDFNGFVLKMFCSFWLQGGTQHGAQTGLRTGRIYILDIQSQNLEWSTTDDNSSVDETAITYYSCLDNNG